MSESRFQKDQAFVLHTSNYQESSLICRLLTRQHGYLSVVCKGARRSKNNRKVLLQPFHLLDIEFSGRSDLKSLISVEQGTGARQVDERSLPVFSPLDFVQPQKFACASYLNELLIRLLHAGESLEYLFDDYSEALADMVQGRPLPQILRRFEWKLVCALGVAPSFDSDLSGREIETSEFYWVQPEQKPQLVNTPENNSFSGELLLQIAAENFAQADPIAARRLLQTLLQPLLGDKPLQSRKLWQHRR